MVVTQTGAVQTDAAPAAVGPYSQGRWAGDFFFSAGQVPLIPGSGEMRQGTTEEQTRQVMNNLEAVLKAAGLGFNNVTKTNVYLTDMDDFVPMNSVYAESFEPPYPARSTVAVKGLPKGARVEIDVVACRG